MTDLDARYGRTRSRGRRERVLAWTVGIAIGVVMVAWVWWAGLADDSGSLETRDVGHSIVNAYEVSVDFEVSVEAGTPVACAIQALNPSFGIVGWKQIDLPASETFTTSHRVSVLTSERATTGLVYRCWLA